MAGPQSERTRMLSESTDLFCGEAESFGMEDESMVL